MRHEEVPNPLPSPYFVYWESDGRIEAVEVLEYDLSSPDCKTKTFLVRGDSGPYRASIGMFFATAEGALASYQEDLRQSVLSLEQSIQRYREEIDSIKALPLWRAE